MRFFVFLVSLFFLMAFSNAQTFFPVVLNGTKYLTENTTDFRYDMSGVQQFKIEIVIENATIGQTTVDEWFDAVMVGSFKRYRSECFGLGMKSAQLIGVRKIYGSNTVPDARVGSGFPLYYVGKHTYEFSYNGTTLILKQDGILVGARNKNGVSAGCYDRVPLTVGCAFNPLHYPDYFANGAYYSLKIWKYNPTTPTLIGDFDFTSVDGTASVFPNLASGASDILYLREYNP